MSIWNHKKEKVVLFTKRKASTCISAGGLFWQEDTDPDTMQEYGWGLIAPATLSRWSS